MINYATLIQTVRLAERGWTLSAEEWIKKVRPPWPILSIAGVMAITFGVVWATVFFPNYEKVPSDVRNVVEYEGSYSVIDPIVEQIGANLAIQRLISNPASLELLAEPEVQQFLTGPELSGLLADTTILQQLVANLDSLVKSLCRSN